MAQSTRSFTSESSLLRDCGRADGSIARSAHLARPLHSPRGQPDEADQAVVVHRKAPHAVVGIRQQTGSNQWL
jgi:hypothetical protein